MTDEEVIQYIEAIREMVGAGHFGTGSVWVLRETLRLADIELSDRELAFLEAYLVGAPVVGDAILH